MKELLSLVLLSYLIGWDRADTFPKIEWSEKQIFFSVFCQLSMQY